MYAFNYQKPASVADAVKAMAGDAKALAGGMTLIPTMKQRLAQTGTLVDLGGLSELRGIHVSKDSIGIGALTTHADVAASAEVRRAIPALAALAGGIADPAVRNRGTIGGSIANNDPAADYPAGVLALGATIVTNKRQIPADQFFTGLFSTALEPGELITAIGFPIPQKAGYSKFEQRASRYALVGVFVAQMASGVRVAVTGAGSGGVYRSAELEKALAGSFTADAAKAVALGPKGMLADIHAAADYRAALVSIVASRAVTAAG